MFRVLRIVCCVLCAAIIAACVFLFVYLGTYWGLISLLCAAILFALTLLFKGLEEDYNKKHPANDAVQTPPEEIQPNETLADKPDEHSDKDKQ